MELVPQRCQHPSVTTHTLFIWGFIKSYKESFLHTDGQVLEIMRPESDKTLPENRQFFRLLVT